MSNARYDAVVKLKQPLNVHQDLFVYVAGRDVKTYFRPLAVSIYNLQRFDKIITALASLVGRVFRVRKTASRAEFMKNFRLLKYFHTFRSHDSFSSPAPVAC